MSAKTLKIVGLFFFLVLCGTDLWAAGPEDMVRQAIIERLLGNDEQLIRREIPVPVEHIRKIAAERIGVDLPVSTDNISGITFEFTERGVFENNLLYVGAWVFSYVKSEVARNKAKKITGKHFRKSKILTPFSYFVDDNNIIIVFTESAGNKSVVDFIESFRACDKCL
jgi:hypothetical protein